MGTPEKARWTLGELAAETGLSRRTIRYYIAQGLLEGPLGAGRGAHYGPEHLERLHRIRELQERGMTLRQIALELGGAPVSALPAPEVWKAFRVAPGVVVQVRADVAPWRMKEVLEGLAELAARLGGPGDGTGQGHGKRPAGGGDAGRSGA